ncbi:MAG: FGGY family carbohydrate kinase [Thermodesulfobacteriota bacterium]
MSDELYLAIDQGGHASRVMVFDHQGRVVTEGSTNIGTRRNEEDHIEHDPDEIIASLWSALALALENLGDKIEQIKNGGLATQRSSIVCWDRQTGEPLSPIISWQDTRTAKWMKKFAQYREMIHQKTGLFPTAHYGASKLRWCLDNLPRVAQSYESGRLAFGPLASFLLFHLLEEQPILVDPANGSRTLLWNCQQLDWDNDLLQLFEVPREALPVCVPTHHQYGHLNCNGHRIPLTIVNGDQSAALFAFAEPEPDTAYVNIGTGAFVQQVLAEPRDDVENLLTSVVWADDRHTRYVLEGTVNGAGSALDEIGRSLGIKARAVEAHLEEWLLKAQAPPLFLNGVSGLGAPYWVADFTSRFVDEGEGWEKIVAVIESILFLLNENLHELEKYLSPTRQLVITGGLSALDGLCQRLADLTQRPVYRPGQCEATARGTAYLLAQPREWPEPSPGTWFYPSANHNLEDRYHRWQIALNDALSIDK